MIDANGKDIKYGNHVRQYPDGEIVARVWFLDYEKMIVKCMIVDEIRRDELVDMTPDQLEVI